MMMMVLVPRGPTSSTSILHWFGINPSFVLVVQWNIDQQLLFPWHQNHLMRKLKWREEKKNKRKAKTDKGRSKREFFGRWREEKKRTFWWWNEWMWFGLVGYMYMCYVGYYMMAIWLWLWRNNNNNKACFFFFFFVFCFVFLFEKKQMKWQIYTHSSLTTLIKTTTINFIDYIFWNGCDDIKDSGMIWERERVMADQWKKKKMKERLYDIWWIISKSKSNQREKNKPLTKSPPPPQSQSQSLSLPSSFFFSLSLTCTTPFCLWAMNMNECNRKLLNLYKWCQRGVCEWIEKKA